MSIPPGKDPAFKVEAMEVKMEERVWRKIPIPQNRKKAPRRTGRPSR